MKCSCLKFWLMLAVAALALPLQAAEPPLPQITNFNASASQKGLRFEPYPSAQAYSILSTTNLARPFLANTNFFLAPLVTGYSTNGLTIVTNLAYEWRSTNAAGPMGFYRLGVTPLASNAVLSAIVLNRLAYGPTPDELERIGSNPQGYIDEQLNMEGLAETLDTYVVQTTNAFNLDPSTNWTFVSVTGKLSGTTLYLYLSQPADVFLDDIQLVEGLTAGLGPNLLANGDFESTLSTGWTLTGSVTASGISNAPTHSGGGSLHLVASAAGSTSANNIKQTFTTSVTNNAIVTLSYWYLPNPNSSRLRLQLPGSGLGSSAGSPPATPTWVYAKATGLATAVNRLYFYLSGAGDCYIDDVKLVAGSTAEAGANLLLNGDFESTLTGPWSKSTDFASSALSSSVVHSGSSSLHLVATAAGSGSGDSLYQTVSGLVSGQTYTLSYWYVPGAPGQNLTAKLDGNSLLSSPDTDVGGLYRRLSSVKAGLSDYRAWFCQHAIGSRRQLLEVLSQFIENHFVTQQSKSATYLTGLGFDSTSAGILATDWEYREMNKWRNALLNPQCSFYDLLKISAESPAMLVYLDTVISKGSGANTANENYARELLELFTFGVDNGYDQNDIILMSRAWTGWSVDMVDAANLDNPFAPLSVTYYPNTNSTAKANTVGVWTYYYNSANHGTNRGPLFAAKTVPARFGPPWAGRSYQLSIPVRTGTNSIQDGYDVIAHLANQPFTQEYICVKLCRLFVHDDFPNPTTVATQPEYAFYDYTDPNHSAEAELVHQCMLSWENSSPKGQIRAVLSTIFNSPLFRTHAGAAQKIKTPLEFVASSVRALRSLNSDGSATASSDGYSFATPLNRMGQMLLFDRDAPDGYSETAPRWVSAGTLTERLRYIQAFCIASGGSGRTDAGNNLCDPVALLKKKLPSSSWNSAPDVADYFLSIFYPGEGAANLALYRAAAISCLNTSDDGLSASAFSGLGNTTTGYDTRLRATVAMLLTFQRFQEQ